MKFAKTVGLMALLLAYGAAHAAAPTEADVANAEETVSKVRAAARFLHDKGSSAYADFNQKDGKWVWKDSYVFVYDCRKDRMIAHPMRPDLVGKPILQITDNAGKYIFKELCKAGNEPRGGWVEYSWPKPGAGRLSRKISYAMTADVSFATGIQVSAGIYDEGIPLPELAKVLERMSDPSKYPAM
ncbi:cache domain-containing protein [Candidatus Accumulibacter vicinus]|uniref:Methyl-accepting chemotaxis protein 4 n=1 Tax=Candidatus Accumulibacter vicinus TaxID=2954382 RepID=A0A084XZB3_9PROT|nr:cache domain-containing protein [Candidatus Accumulibacter vicinus]KFB67807.1 MAG: Methyl-accepting chemotaxis protein 4 [Candidatus Accumulibacter vicinus]